MKSREEVPGIPLLSLNIWAVILRGKPNLECTSLQQIKVKTTQSVTHGYRV